MKRVTSLLFAAAMMLAFMVPAASAQADSTPTASPQATPAAVEREEGETDYQRGINMLTIELTALEDGDDGKYTVETLDPETALANDQLTFVDELDAPGDCRLFEFEVEGADPFTIVFLGVCADDDFGLFVFGSQEDDVAYTLEQFDAGEAELVPEEYEEAD